MSKKLPRRTALTDALQEAGRELGARSVMFHHAIAERVGLNITDSRCFDLALRAVERGEGPLTAGQIADLTGLTTGAVTGVIDRLEQARFVRRVRDPHDRRRVIVEPVSERGEEIGPLFDPLAAAMEKLCARYTSRDLAMILDFLTRCATTLREQAVRLRGEAAAEGIPKSTAEGGAKRRAKKMSSRAAAHKLKGG